MVCTHPEKSSDLCLLPLPKTAEKSEAEEQIVADRKTNFLLIGKGHSVDGYKNSACKKLTKVVGIKLQRRKSQLKCRACEERRLYAMKFANIFLRPVQSVPVSFDLVIRSGF